MRFLSIYGTDGFRTFTGVLNGKSAYTPANIPIIDPEILTERSFDLRIEAIVAPYTNNHPALKTVLPTLSSKIGTLHKISEQYSIWRPKYHLSYLGQLLLATLREEFISEDFKHELTFIGDNEDHGEAFQNAFSLENKVIHLPIGTTIKQDPQTSYSFYNPSDLSFISHITKTQQFRCDHYNFFRIIGHMATILEALYYTEETKQRFYNDPVSIAIPADSMEYLLAAFYLSQSALPIKNIYAISQRHRMIHQFLQKGEFKITDKAAYEKLEISLDRMLFELARGSVEKIVSWKKELAHNGSFRIDTTALGRLKKFQSHFAGKSSEIPSGFPITPTRLSLCGYQLSQKATEHVLAFDLHDNDY
ncbi:MAG: hypothetical protein ACRCWI_06720 [Brevinema sp.]